MYRAREKQMSIYDYLPPYHGELCNANRWVQLAQLYVQGAISFGSLFAGLTAGAGEGLAVLWRVNPSWKQNLFMTGLLWAIGAAVGMLLQILPI